MSNIPIKEWYPTYEDWLLSPVIYTTKNGAKSLPLGKPDKFLKPLLEKHSHKPTHMKHKLISVCEFEDIGFKDFAIKQVKQDLVSNIPKGYIPYGEVIIEFANPLKYSLDKAPVLAIRGIQHLIPLHQKPNDKPIQ